MLQTGLDLIDCQVVSQHLMSIGAETMPRREFTAELQRLCEPATPFAGWPQGPVPVADVLLNWRNAALH